MLDLDLDLEADLGIDTVKQAELFATIREAYGIPRDDKLKLRDFPTLSHVMGFVRDRRPACRPPQLRPPRRAAAPAAAAKGCRAVAPRAGDRRRRERVLALVAEKTGYPPDMLDLDLDLEADLGIDTVKQAELFATIREAYGIPRDDKLKLRDFPTLSHVLQFVRDRRPGRWPHPPPRRPPRPRRGRLPRPRSSLRPDRAPAATRSWSACSRSSPRRPATRPTCSISISISRPTSASTR